MSTLSDLATLCIISETTEGAILTWAEEYLDIPQ